MDLILIHVNVHKLLTGIGWLSDRKKNNKKTVTISQTYFSFSITCFLILQAQSQEA